MVYAISKGSEMVLECLGISGASMGRNTRMLGTSSELKRCADKMGKAVFGNVGKNTKSERIYWKVHEKGSLN